MRYDNPELMDRLAAEYVLGTLRGAARLRFERLLQDRPQARERVAAWEMHFAKLAETVPGVQPPKAVWSKIFRQINNRQPGLAHSLVFWRSWSALATLCSILLLVVVLQSSQISEDQLLPRGSDHIALVGGDADPLWVIGANLNTGELTVRAINAKAADLDKVFELWMLPNEGNPESIGLLPVNGGSVTHRLPAGLSALLRQSKGLAVSIEPPGGSPTGLPTGPVVHTANMVNL